MAWARVLGVWLDDEEPELSKTMAALDRELSRGERLVARVESLDRFASPLKALARAAFETRRHASEAFRHRPRRRDAETEREHRL
jgi:hypothetical protein